MSALSPLRLKWTDTISKPHCSSKPLITSFALTWSSIRKCRQLQEERKSSQVKSTWTFALINRLSLISSSLSSLPAHSHLLAPNLVQKHLLPEGAQHISTQVSPHQSVLLETHNTHTYEHKQLNCLVIGPIGTLSVCTCLQMLNGEMHWFGHKQAAVQWERKRHHSSLMT